ncbi:MAG: HlyD family efflux transporter periplasmic adaptor subunit [Paucimonas sp.]|nr:HlyD family efflux transporter periplasmic adaptor subunit [Paucimonas sp.]
MSWIKKYRIPLIAAGVILLLAGVWKAIGMRSGATEYKTVQIEKGSIVAAVSASGTLSPVVSVQVGSQVSGQLKEVLVDYNSEVKQGQLIARIDPETFEYKVRQAQADVDAARSQVLTQRANINAQRAEVSRVEVTLADAKRDLERKKQLVDKGFISAAELEKAQATYNALNEQLKTAQAQVAVAQAGAGNAEALVKQREAALAQARIDLERTKIKAPVSGVVIKRSVEKGQTVAASLQAPELFIIAENLSDMQVDTSIDESDIGRIRLGQKATFTVDAFPGRTFEGEVKQIRKAAQNVSNVVTYTVAVSAANPRKELLPGMTANVRIVIDTRHDVLKVANAALRFRPPGEKSDKAEAGPAVQSSGGPRGGQMQAMRERLEKDLDLTDSQKQKLDAIFSGMRSKFAAMRDAPDSERRRIGERHRAEMQAQVSEMLTPEQRRKYEAIMMEASDRRGGGQGKIYVIGDKDKPRAIEVKTGLSDGTSTEITAPELKEGMEVISGTPVSTPAGNASRAHAPPGPRMF